MSSSLSSIWSAREIDADLAAISGADGRQVIGSYAAYADAQRAVDRLSDASFPVQHTAIVGHDMRLVERVTGRVTTARAAAAGAASGAWFGLLIGLLVGLFTPGPAWLGLILGGVVIGALWGATFGFFAHRATRGQRDFGSTRGFVASRYEVTVADAYAAGARQVLAEPS
jgi:uncharacterized membrane protein